MSCREVFEILCGSHVSPDCTVNATLSFSHMKQRVQFAVARTSRSEARTRVSANHGRGSTVHVLSVCPPASENTRESAEPCARRRLAADENFMNSRATSESTAAGHCRFRCLAACPAAGRGKYYTLYCTDRIAYCRTAVHRFREELLVIPGARLRGPVSTSCIDQLQQQRHYSMQKLSPMRCNARRTRYDRQDCAIKNSIFRHFEND